MEHDLDAARKHAKWDADAAAVAWAQDRIELLERTLRDCLESLEWYAHAKGHHPENATPTSIIGQARVLLEKR